MKKGMIWLLSLILIMTFSVPAFADEESIPSNEEPAVSWEDIQEPELPEPEIIEEKVTPNLSMAPAPYTIDANSTELELLVAYSEEIRVALLAGQSSISMKEINRKAGSLTQLTRLNYYCPYLDGKRISITLYYSGDTYTEMRITNTLSKEETKNWINMIDQEIDDILGQVDSSLSEADKALFIHDYMTSHYYYDLTYSNYYASDFLTEGKGVCNAYTYLYQYLLTQLGIECYSTQSDSMNHAWNILKLNGKYYHVDVTWDDPVEDGFGHAWHSYFLVSDDTIKDSDHGHYGWNRTELVCNDTSYEDDYFVEANTPVVFDGNLRYYINYDGLKSYNTATGKTKLLAENGRQEDFYLYNTGLCRYGGKLYFNTDYTVYSYRLSDGTIRPYVGMSTEELSEDDETCIRGCNEDKGILYYSIEPQWRTPYAQKDIHSVPILNKCDGNHMEVYNLTKEPTCTEDGNTEGSYCSLCGSVIKEMKVLPAKGHVEEMIYEGYPATCYEEGLTAEYYCTECYETTRPSEIIPATPHKMKRTIEKAEPFSYGYIEEECEVCGERDSEGISFPEKISLSYTSCTYSGSAKKPAVTVKDGDGKTISSSNYSVTYTDNVKVGKAKVKVTFKGSKYKGSMTKTFKINPKGTSISSLTKASKAFTAKWKKQATQTTGYQIRYSTKSSMASAKTVTVSKNTTVSKKITSLKAKKKYYVQVRTYKTVSGTRYYSSWSTKKSVTTK